MQSVLIHWQISLCQGWPRMPLQHWRSTRELCHQVCFLRRWFWNMHDQRQPNPKENLHPRRSPESPEPQVLNIACRAPRSSNRPISPTSDWPIFSCLGSTTSSPWKTLDDRRRKRKNTAQSSFQLLYTATYNPWAHTLEPSFTYNPHTIAYNP